MKKLLRLLALTVLFTLVICPAVSALTAKTTCYTRIKDFPDRNAATIGIIRQGQKVGTLLGHECDADGVLWYQIAHNGRLGFVESSLVYISDFYPVLHTNGPVYVREAPDPLALDIGSYKGGRRVHCTGVIDGGWVRVRYAGRVGWVYGGYFK